MMNIGKQMREAVDKIILQYESADVNNEGVDLANVLKENKEDLYSFLVSQQGISQELIIKNVQSKISDYANKVNGKK